MTALGVSALGSLQDVTRFSDDVPGWLESGVVMFFTPFMAAMVSIIALTNATVLDDALQSTLRTNRELVDAKATLAQSVTALRAVACSSCGGRGAANGAGSNATSTTAPSRRS